MFLCGVLFPRVFEHVVFFCLFVLALLLSFACAKFWLFSGPTLGFLLFWSAFYAGKAVLTACLRVIRLLFLVLLCFHNLSSL